MTLPRLFTLLIFSLLVGIECSSGELNNKQSCEVSDQGPGTCGVSPESVAPKVCFVVRTYWGHGDAHGGELRSFLTSLQDQTYSNWEAVFVVVDKEPFAEMHDIIASMNETRAWVFAEWIGREFLPKKNGEWVDGYHGVLYNVTDSAIRLCSSSSEWVVVTNGDNLYGKSFVSRILEMAEPSTDIVKFDFYSRFNKPSMPSCDRFTPEYNRQVPCKRNTLRWCQTDLGSVALRREKLIKEKRYFGSLDNEGYGLDEAHNDGLMFEELLQDGWKVSEVNGECLFVHSPSIQSCGWNGHVWDDSDISATGGHCISTKEAETKLSEDSNLEMVQIQVAHADNYAGEFRDVKQPLVKVKCVRKKNHKAPNVWGQLAFWFGERCTDDEDMDLLKRAVWEYHQYKKEANISTV